MFIIAGTLSATISTCFDPSLINKVAPTSGLADLIFLFISNLGGSAFYYSAVPFIYWCNRKDVATNLAVMLLTSYYINFSAKEYFKVPRPPKETWVKGVNAISYSFPSGHAQGSTSFWLYSWGQWKRYWLIVVGSIWIALVSYSRIYLGVHRWEDIVAGWILGAGVVIAFWLMSKRVVAILDGMRHSHRLALAMAVPLMMFLIYRSVIMAHLMGFLMGVLVGSEIERTDLRMPDTCHNGQRIKRMVVGYPLCGVILFVLGGYNGGDVGWQLLVYTLSGMAVTCFTPMLFSLFEDWDRMRVEADDDRR